MKPALVLAMPTMLLTVSLVACGGDKPAVCDSVDNLKSSVQDVQDVDVTGPGGPGDLQTALTAVETDLAAVKADAKSQFTTQISAVEASYAALASTVTAAKADPTAATLTAAASAVSSFGTDAETLTSDVDATC